MHRNPSLAVDAAIVDSGRILLIERGRDPYKGKWALPGGFVEYGETVEDAAIREVLEETGVKIDLVEILGVYSTPDRDPRQHTISVAFVGKYVS